VRLDPRHGCMHMAWRVQAMAMWEAECGAIWTTVWARTSGPDHSGDAPCQFRSQQNGPARGRASSPAIVPGSCRFPSCIDTASLVSCSASAQTCRRTSTCNRRRPRCRPTSPTSSTSTSTRPRGSSRSRRLHVGPQPTARMEAPTGPWCFRIRHMCASSARKTGPAPLWAR
jgi:hypothetical protein